VVRNKAISKLMWHLPIEIRGANRREWTSQSNVRLAGIRHLLPADQRLSALIGNARTERPMRTAIIVMADPLTKSSSQMAGTGRDDIVQAFATYGADPPFAMGIGGRPTNRGSQDADTPELHRLIQAVRERLVCRSCRRSW
jgi:hypothetical protein